MLKLCSACDKLKPRSEFRKQAKVKDGLQAECKECARARDKQAYNRETNSACDRKLRWQIVNAETQKMIALKYYHSPRARVNRMLNKRLTDILGQKRDSVLHLVGIDAKLLSDHMESIVPPEFCWDSYQSRWGIALAVPYTEGCDPRRIFHWSNLMPRAKLSPEDLELV